MLNPMTGDFEAVVQVAERQINTLLAALHQNGLSSDSPLKLLHSVRARVGVQRRPTPDLDALDDWVGAIQSARPPGPKPPLRDLLVASAPPGVAKQFVASFQDLPDLEPLPPVPVRGTAAIQLSTVAVDVVAGSFTEVNLVVNVRVHYTPDPSTTPLPQTFHGTVKAAFEIRRFVIGEITRLVIKPSADDEKIQFIPSPGSTLSSSDTARITVQLRKILRDGFLLVPVDLPEEFPFSIFKGVGTGDSAAIALPLQISGAPPVPGGAIGITQSIVGSAHGFAFGVSGDHVLKVIEPSLAQIRASVEELVVPIDLLGSTRDYRLRFLSGPQLTFKDGGIDVTGSIKARGPSMFDPSGTITFTQTITLKLAFAQQRVDLVRVGTPSVDVSGAISVGFSDADAAAILQTQIDIGLGQIGPQIRPVFDDAKTGLVEALQKIKIPASAKFAQASVTSHGVIIRGDLFTEPRFNPIVSFDQTPDGGFSAFESWIPGGTVESYTWSWIEHPTQHLGIFGGTVKVMTVADSFLLAKPGGYVSRVCLRMNGERLMPDGVPRSVSAGAMCEIDEPVFRLDAPSWWQPMMIPVWKPDIAPDARLSEAIRAHVSVQTDRPQRELTDNTIVFFPDWESGASFDALARGLEKMQRRNAPPTLLIIVPPGAFDTTRREFEARLAALPAKIGARVVVAEDLAGGWSRSFDVNKLPAVFLVNARRRFVWNASGYLDPDEIASALDRHLVAAPARRFTRTPMKVNVGLRAPDVIFEDDQRQERALHRLHGEPVIMTFWQSTSMPSLAELRRLQAILDSDRSAPFVVGFHGGPGLETFDDIRKTHGITFPLVHDREHRAARTYGVRCWPTTITVGPDGVIAGIQLGAEARQNVE